MLLCSPKSFITFSHFCLKHEIKFSPVNIGVRWRTNADTSLMAAAFYDLVILQTDDTNAEKPQYFKEICLS